MILNSGAITHPVNNKEDNMIKKKLLVPVLTVALACETLAGCGTSSGTSVATTATDSTSEAATEAEAAATAVSEAASEANTTAGTTDATIPSFKIGMPWWTSTDPSIVSIENNVKAAVEAAGGELIEVDSDMSADTLIDNITELISRDVDGILLMPASDSMLPTVDQMCSDAGVYYATYFRDIHDETIK